MISSSDRHLTPLALDLLVSDALPPNERALYETHLATCVSCAEALNGRRRAETEFARSVFPRTAPHMVAAHRRRRAVIVRLYGLLGLSGAAAAAVVLWVAVPRGGTRSDLHVPGAAVDGDAIKGSPSLHVFVRHPDGWGAAVAPGTVLHPGDAVRFVVDPPGARFLLIASVDGAGGVTTYFPYRGAASAPVEPTRRFEVPGSITLDDAPGPERVFAFFSEQPVTAAEVRRALTLVARGGARAIRNTREVAGVPAAQSSFVFEKAP